MSEIVHACPECGQIVAHTCYHEGDDLSAVDMPASQAKALREIYACDQADRLRIEDLDEDRLEELGKAVQSEFDRRDSTPLSRQESGSEG